MKKIISLRDDDINWFTDPKQLEAWYEPIFHLVKPTLCVTPFAGEIYWKVRESELLLQSKKDKLEFVRGLLLQKDIDKIRYSIYENEQLMKLLRKWCSEDKVEIALHGITHNQSPNGFECEGDPPSFDELNIILTNLEEALGTKIKWFSPPNNSIKKSWMKVLKLCGLNLIHSIGPKPWETQLNLRTLVSLSRIVIDVISHGRKSRLNQVLSLGDIALLQSIPFSPGMQAEQIFANLREASNSGGSIVIATHSYAFNYAPELYLELVELLNCARDLGFLPDTFSEQLKCAVS